MNFKLLGFFFTFSILGSEPKFNRHKLTGLASEELAYLELYVRECVVDKMQRNDRSNELCLFAGDYFLNGRFLHKDDKLCGYLLRKNTSDVVAYGKASRCVRSNVLGEPVVSDITEISHGNYIRLERDVQERVLALKANEVEASLEGEQALSDLKSIRCLADSEEEILSAYATACSRQILTQRLDDSDPIRTLQMYCGKPNSINTNFDFERIDQRAAIIGVQFSLHDDLREVAFLAAAVRRAIKVTPFDDKDVKTVGVGTRTVCEVMPSGITRCEMPISLEETKQLLGNVREQSLRFGNAK